MTYKASDYERFNQKYVVRLGGCWEWVGAKVGCEFNYGKFWLNGKYDKAHRASYRLHKGDIPDGMWVLHRCDNPECVNPEHLFLGTRQDNVDDMLRKGRNGHWKNPPRGDRRKDSKLTADKVLEIRRLCSQGLSQGEVAKLFGVVQPTIFKIVHRQRWAHI